MMFFDLVFDEENPLRGLMYFLLFLVPFPFSYGFFSDSFSQSMSEDLLLFWSAAAVFMVYGVLAWVYRKASKSDDDVGELRRAEVR